MTSNDRKITDSLLDIENAEWRDSLDYVLKTQGEERVQELLRLLQVVQLQHQIFEHLFVPLEFLIRIYLENQNK